MPVLTPLPACNDVLPAGSLASNASLHCFSAQKRTSQGVHTAAGSGPTHHALARQLRLGEANE